jgi:tetratricopeptide (TPR) repeat protein
MRKLAVPLFAALAVFGAPHDDLKLLIENGHYKRARALAEQRLPGGAGDAQLQYLAARVKLAFGDMEGAARHAEKAASLDSKNADYQFELVEVYGTQAERASLLKQASLGRKTKKAIDRTLELNPRHIEGLRVLMMYYYRAPGIIGGDKEKARQIPAEIGKIDSSQGFLTQVRLNAMEKNNARHEELFGKAVAADSNNFEAHSGLVSTYLNRKPPAFDLAEKHAREMIRINPERGSGWMLLAYMFGSQDKPAEAEKVIADAEHRISDSRWASLAAAEGLLNAGRNFDKAEAWIKRYLEVEPERGQPDHGRARWRLAQLYEKSGRKQEAVRELEAALKQRPSDENLKKELKRLKG